GDLAVAGEFELRQSWPCHDIGAGQQPLDDRAHGGGAEQQRLVAAAAVQDAVGEDVPALKIGRDLDLVDREERDVEIPRPRLHRGNPVARFRRLYLFLAGDEGNVIDADPVNDLVVDLAR